MSLFINASEIRHFLTRETNLKTKKEKSAKVSQEEIYKMIGEAVRSLSRTKTGALITFEKNADFCFKTYFTFKSFGKSSFWNG